MLKIILIFLGGGLGSVCRYLITEHFQNINNTYKLLLINVLGSFIIGLCSYFYNKENMNLFLFLTTGWCGGFTTFSAFSNNSVELFKESNLFILILNIFLSVSLSILACYLGLLINKKV